MKKFFKSLALASIAMAGMLVSSCQVDDIVTAFVPNAAVATIKVTVTDAVNGTDITSVAELSASSTGNQVLEREGNVFTLKGNKNLSAQTVTITATYNGVTGTDEVKINALLAGGLAEYKAHVLVGKITPPTPPEPDVVTSYALNLVGYDNTDIVGTFQPSHQQGHSHSGSIWAFNETEFILNAKFNWHAIYGVYEVAGMPDQSKMRESENITFNAFYNALNNITAEEEDIEVVFPISAFAMYTIVGTITDTVKSYEVVREESVDGTVLPPVVIGTIKVKSYSTQVEYKEQAVPGHEGHYHEGHGHADTHGYSNNAGGGIVWGD